MEISPVVFFISTVLFSTNAFVVVLVAITLVTWKKQSSVLALIILAAAAVLKVSVTTLKHLFAVPRPPDALVELTSYAFPSGHAAGILFLAWVVDWFFVYVLQVKRLYLLRALLVVFVCGVGYSRIYLGVHTWEQVLAGFGVGAVVGGLFQYGMYRVRRLSAKSS